MDEWFDHPNVTALLFPHLPGQESGSTLVKALYGEINPSGKMPYSILSTNNTDSYPQIVSDMGDDGTIPVDFSEGLFIDYRKFDRDDVQSLIPFGHGLSYTTFKHSPNLQAKAITDGSCYPNELSETSRKLAPGGLSWLWKYAVQLDAKVTNTGAWDGAEVSQLYVQFPDSVADTPRKQLVGFEKLYLKRGESKNATFKVTLRDLSYWNVEKQEFVVPDGEFVFKVGSSSADEDLQSTVKVEVKDSQVVQ